MKTLTLLRHAKSSWDDPSRSDFDRPLNARGRKAARAMGREMHRLGLAFDQVVASPSRRTVETIEEAAETYGAIAPDCDERVYLAAPVTLIQVIRETDDAYDRLLIVGHNPGTERLALLLSRGGSLRDEIAAKYPTGALAEIRFDVKSWRDIGEGRGTLERFIRPRDLDSELGPDTDSG